MTYATSKTDKLIPDELGQRLTVRARKSTLLKLENYIELRDFISENEERIIDRGWMAFYEEAGDRMDYDSDSVRKDLRAVRNYTDENLKYWIQNGLSFDHLEAANDLQNYEACHFDGEQLLNAAIQMGGQNGKRMTVKELRAFALGESPVLDMATRFISDIFSRLEKIPLRFKWDLEKTKRFEQRVQELRQEFLS